MIIGFIVFGVSIIIGFITIFVMAFIWEMQSSFVRVYFHPDTSQDIENGKVYIELIIENQEPVEIKDCIVTMVTLSRLFHFPNTTDLYDEALNTGRLKWRSGYAHEDGKNIIPLDSKSEKLHFAVFDKKTHKTKFIYNKSESTEFDIAQVFLLKLRLDGRVDDKNISPKYFEGYFFLKFNATVSEGILVSSEVLSDGIEKIQREKLQNVKLTPIIAFDEGNWKEDDSIPSGIKNYKICPATHIEISTP